MEFDVHAKNYQEVLDRSLAFSGEGSAYYASLKADQLRPLALQLNDGQAVRALDVGCGLGLVLEHLDLALFPEPTGTDVSQPMLARARQRVPRATFLPCDESGDLPHPDGAFDLTFTACTLHHVPVPARPRFVRSLARVTRPGGLVVIFEHNPFNPLTRAIVHDCAFDRDAVLLRAREVRNLLRGADLVPGPTRYYLFLPAFLRTLRFLESWLTWLPLGGQYLVAAEVPR